MSKATTLAPPANQNPGTTTYNTWSTVTTTLREYDHNHAAKSWDYRVLGYVGKTAYLNCMTVLEYIENKSSSLH